MLIQVNNLGSETGELCRTNVKLPYSAVGVKLVSINLPYNAGAFSPTFVNGITVNTNPNEIFSVPSFGSWSDLRAFFNELRTAANQRVFYVFGDEDVDICTDQFQILFTQELADYFGVGVGIGVNACITTTLNMDQKDPVFDYVVKFFAPINATDHVIGAVHSTRGDAYSSDWHALQDTAEYGRLEVYCRLKNGTEFIASCPEDSRWGVELEV